MNWKDIFKEESSKDYYKHIIKTVQEDAKNNNIYPPHSDIFNAFTLTPLDNTEKLCADEAVNYVPRSGGNTYGDAGGSGDEAAAESANSGSVRHGGRQWPSDPAAPLRPARWRTRTLSLVSIDRPQTGCTGRNAGRYRT